MERGSRNHRANFGARSRIPGTRCTTHVVYWGCTPSEEGPMRPRCLVLVIALIPAATFAQIFGTAQTMPRARFALTVAPLLVVHGDMQPGLFATGGIGLTRGIDLGINARLSRGLSYVGADVEWRLLHRRGSISLATGMHGSDRGLGLELALNLSYPLRQVAVIYAGSRVDFEFGDHPVWTPVWVFLGTEIRISRGFGLLLEADIGAYEAPHLFGLGGVFYF